MRVSYLDWILFSNKGKPFAEFEKETLHISDQSFLKAQFRIFSFLRNS